MALQANGGTQHSTGFDLVHMKHIEVPVITMEFDEQEFTLLMIEADKTVIELFEQVELKSVIGSECFKLCCERCLMPCFPSLDNCKHDNNGNNRSC